MRKKRLVTLLLAFMFVLGTALLAGCGSGSDKKEGDKKEAAGEVAKIKVAHTSAPGTPIFLTYEKFGQLVEEKSGGKIKVEIFPTGTLGGDQATVEAVQKGSIDIASSGINNMAPFTDMFFFADLPYIFRSLDGVHKVFGGEIGEELKQKLEQENKLKLLFYADTGSFRNVMNSKRPIKTPTDMAGLKFRSAASPVEMATVKAFGANPTPVTWPETYMALEQKVVDGELQSFHWAVTAKHQEVIRYVTMTGGQHAVHIAVMNLDTFNKLTPELQQVILDAAKEAQEYNFANAEKISNDELVKVMKEAGVEIYNPTAEEMKQWTAAGEKVWQEFKDKVPQEMIDRTLKAQE